MLKSHSSSKLGTGFKHLLFFYPTGPKGRWRWSNLTKTSQTGWNHQPQTNTWCEWFKWHQMTHFDLRIHFKSFLRWVAQYGPITLYDLESRWRKSHWFIVSCVRSMSCHQLWGPTARSQDSRAPPFTYVRTDAFHLQVGVPSEGERSCVRGVQALRRIDAEVGGLYQGSGGLVVSIP